MIIGLSIFYIYHCSLLQVEHQERRSKIQNFVKTLQKTSTRSTKMSGGYNDSEIEEGHSNAHRQWAHRRPNPSSPLSGSFGDEQEHEHFPRTCPPPLPTTTVPLSYPTRRSRMEDHQGSAEQPGDESDEDRYEDDKEWQLDVDDFNDKASFSSPPSFSSLPSSSSPASGQRRGTRTLGNTSPRSSITTSPVRSPRRGIKPVIPSRQQVVPTATSRSQTSSYASTRGTSSVAQNRHMQHQRGREEESAKERRERLRVLQRETAERVAKNKANEMAMKRFVDSNFLLALS